MPTPAPPPIDTGFARAVARDQDVAAGREILDAGGSVLVTGPVGVGTETVARLMLDQCRPTTATAVVVGTEGLRGHPLAAIGVAGLLPTMGGAGDPGERVGRALTALAVRQAGAPLVVLVERAASVDAFSSAMLADAVRRGIVQLIVPATEGLQLGEMAAARDSGLLKPLPVTPMTPAELTALAGPDRASGEVERAVSAADGNPAWFVAMLDAQWFTDSQPVPPRLREMADEVLATLSDPVVDVLLVTTVAGLVPLPILVAATDASAVQSALDAGLLTEHTSVLRVRHRLLRARLEERARVQQTNVAARIQQAAAETGTALPLPSDGPPPDAALLAGLAVVVPAEVAAHLDAAGPLPPQIRLIHARTLLASGRTADATRVLDDLAGGAASDGEEVLAEAAMMLAYQRAHVDGDVPAATGILTDAAQGVESPDLRVRLGARQISVEAFGPQAKAAERLAEWEGLDLSVRTSLEVAKARSLVEWSSRARMPQGLGNRLRRLLVEVDASPRERWASLAAVFWLTVFADGVPDGWAMAEEEVRRARDQGDLGIVGSWYALQTGALTVAGHSDAAAAIGARADAALIGHDGFGVRPIALAFSALALHRCGRESEARDALAGSRALMAPESLLTHAIAAVADLRPADHRSAAGERWSRASTIFGELGQPMLVWSAWRGVQNPATAPVALSATARSDDGVDGRLSVIETAGAVAALGAAHALVARGHLALALAGLRRRAATNVDDGGASRLQQQRLRSWLAGIVEPGGAPRSMVEPVTDIVSDRQLEVAVRAAAGRSDQQIASELSLSVRTVSNHLSRLYRATGVADRQELAHLLPPIRVWRPLPA